MFLILFSEFSGLFECFPDRKTRFRIHTFHISIELRNGSPLRVVFVGAVLYLLLIIAQFGITANVGFVNQTEWADDA